MKMSVFVLFVAFCLASCQQSAPKTTETATAATSKTVPAATPKMETATAATPKTETVPAATPKTEATPPAKDRFKGNFSAGGIEDAKAFETFFKTLQTTTIEPAHKEDLANLIEFPIVAAKDKKTFLANYDKIVTAAVRTVVKNQKFDEFRCNGQGCSIEGGTIWFRSKDTGGFCIIGINPSK